MTDLHCHILPDLDDGPKTLYESVAMCRQAAADGVRVIVATPHYRYPGVDNMAKKIPKKIKQLKMALKSKNIPVDIIPGNEVRLLKGLDLTEEIKSGRALTINCNGKYIMVDLPNQSLPFYVFNTIERLKQRGITSIIAHPERNFAIQKDKRLMRYLIKCGALSQITGSSLTKKFSSSDYLCAKELLRNGLVHVIASDAHSLGGRRPMMLLEAVIAAAKIVGKDNAKILVKTNPRKIVMGEQLYGSN